MKKIKYLTLSFILLLMAIIGMYHWITLKAKGFTYNTTTEIPKNNVGLLLGTGKFTKRGNINLFYKYRINAAVELFNSGKIEYILVSGDNHSKNYDEPSEFKKDLIKKGIPENRIILDYAGFRTLDSVIRSKKIFGQSNITVISQKFHNERAIFIAQHFNINAVAYNAKDISTYKLSYYREYLARSKSVIDIFFGVEPKFLGKPVAIE